MSKKIALTFDDGPVEGITTEILNILDEYNRRASFFVVGEKINDETAYIIKRAHEMGCEICNHSFTHSAMPTLDKSEIISEITKTSELVEKITGKPTAFFRPPYIAVNGDMYDVIDLPFICGYGVEDYNSSVTVEERYKRVMKEVKDGLIVLLHDMPDNRATVEAVRRIVPELILMGYELVTVSELFEAKGITPAKNTMYSVLE